MKKSIKGRIINDVFLPDTCNVGIDIKILERVMDIQVNSSKQYKITIEEVVPKAGATVIIDDRSHK